MVTEVFAAGNGYGDAVACANHAEAMDGFADFAQEGFFEVHWVLLSRGAIAFRRFREVSYADFLLLLGLGVAALFAGVACV